MTGLAMPAPRLVTVHDSDVSILALVANVCLSKNNFVTHGQSYVDTPEGRVRHDRYRWGTKSIRELANVFTDPDAVRAVLTNSFNVILPRGRVITSFQPGMCSWETHQPVLERAGRVPLQVNLALTLPAGTTYSDALTLSALTAATVVVVILDTVTMEGFSYALVISCSRHGQLWDVGGVPVRGHLGWLPESHINMYETTFPVWQMCVSRLEPRQLCVGATLGFRSARVTVNSNGILL
eukprot:m.315841 g.315841  ORF g.315841 m.315841 type:complete len:238 (-) comp16415_c0_seq2:69-782(-)